MYIYRQLRNADPADDASAREVINNLFFSEKTDMTLVMWGVIESTKKVESDD